METKTDVLIEQQQSHKIENINISHLAKVIFIMNAAIEFSHIPYKIQSICVDTNNDSYKCIIYVAKDSDLYSEKNKFKNDLIEIIQIYHELINSDKNELTEEDLIKLDNIYKSLSNHLNAI